MKLQIRVDDNDIISDVCDPRPAVLVVEDEGVTRRALAVLLRLNGYDASAVGSAEEALVALSRAPWPEFTLVDLDLPGMNGLDLIQRLQQLGIPSYPVLITAADKDRVLSQIAGKTIVYLQKPLDFARLLTVLHDRQEI